MEQKCGPFVFFSNFDSGNLARVEKVDVSAATVAAAAAGDSDGEKEDNATLQTEAKPDYAFNVWVSPDCAGTQYQNGNRSWFYFGMRGSLSAHIIRISIMNMNRQSKLYAQGYNVIAKFLPNRPAWERLRMRPTYRYNETSFMLTFTCVFPHLCDTAYFAFCYPWSYEDCQHQMAQFDSTFSYCFNSAKSETIFQDSIYYYREAICYTLQGRRVDLITVSDYSNMLPDPEPRFDPKLFPESKERCKAFKNKRVFVLTSRVHPGETPGSFVFNGFLNFILRPSDFRAKRLRQLFVFKLIPMLNPDGVSSGHYRTDTRGVNLNRMYLDPNFDLYPSVYATKALIVFHHVSNRVKTAGSVEPALLPTQSEPPPEKTAVQQTPEERKLPPVVPPSEEPKIVNVSETLVESRNFNEEFLKSQRSNSDLRKCSSAPLPTSYAGGLDQQMRRAGATASNLTVDETVSKPPISEAVHFEIGNEGSDEDDIDFTPQIRPAEAMKYAPHLCDKALLDIPPSSSGVAFYMDLHGHASKRGCFIYGNHLEDENLQVDNVTFAKLISLNSYHFDFDGCNFTEKNMYTKDRHDINSSKEGSGRVALYKAIGLVHSYTLECNYNMGRITNMLSPCVGPGSGRTTPPAAPSYMPIRFTPAQFEEVGRGVAIAALDMCQENPCSRLPSTEFNTLSRLKEWIRYRVLAGRADARIYRTSLTGGAPIFTGPKNAANPQVPQNGTKHRSLSMPAAPASTLRVVNGSGNGNGNAKSPPKPVLLPNRSSNNGNGQQLAKQPQPQPQNPTQTSPTKQPTSPTKRTLSFTTKTASPYFSKPVIGLATNATIVVNAMARADEAAAAAAANCSGSNNSGSQNGTEPASKWPSLCPENNASEKETLSLVSFALRQPQQLLSVTKVEPALTVPTPNWLPCTAPNGQSKPPQPLRLSKDKDDLKSLVANGRTPTERIARPRPISRGYNFISHAHFYPSSPSLVISGNNASAISKSFALQTASIQRQLSADAFQQQHIRMATLPPTATALFQTKQQSESETDAFVAQDSADAITEMFGSSTLEISFPDYVASTAVLKMDEQLEEETSNAMFPPLAIVSAPEMTSSAAAPPTNRSMCSITVIMPFSNPASSKSPNGNDSNNKNNGNFPRNSNPNHHLARRRNGSHAIQRPTLLHPRHHLHLRQAQSPPRRKK